MSFEIGLFDVGILVEIAYLRKLPLKMVVMDVVEFKSLEIKSFEEDNDLMINRLEVQNNNVVIK